MQENNSFININLSLNMEKDKISVENIVVSAENLIPSYREKIQKFLTEEILLKEKERNQYNTFIADHELSDTFRTLKIRVDAEYQQLLRVKLVLDSIV